MDIQVIVNGIMNKLDDTNKALMSEDFISLKSAIKEKDDTIEKQDGEIKSLKGEREELLKVNGNLFRRLGETMVKENNEGTGEGEKEDRIELSSIINEKGDFI